MSTLLRAAYLIGLISRIFTVRKYVTSEEVAFGFSSIKPISLSYALYSSASLRVPFMKSLYALGVLSSSLRSLSFYLKPSFLVPPDIVNVVISDTSIFKVIGFISKIHSAKFNSVIFGMPPSAYLTHYLGIFFFGKLYCFKLERLSF